MHIPLPTPHHHVISCTSPFSHHTNDTPLPTTLSHDIWSPLRTRIGSQSGTDHNLQRPLLHSVHVSAHMVEVCAKCVFCMSVYACGCMCVDVCMHRCRDKVSAYLHSTPLIVATAHTARDNNHPSNCQPIKLVTCQNPSKGVTQQRCHPSCCHPAKGVTQQRCHPGKVSLTMMQWPAF